MKAIAILGTGPAGLLAAHACKLAGLPFSLFSVNDKPSVIGGAQFLHKPIYGIHDAEPDATLRYTVVGHPDTYKKKVYGDEPVPFVSMSNVTDGQMQNAWNMTKTYEMLWEEIAGGGRSVNVMQVGPKDIFDWVEGDKWRHIISTVPRPALCLAHAGLVNEKHRFTVQAIRVMPGVSVLGDGFDNTVIYDGTPNTSWYRTSRIFGVGGTEWGSGAPEKLPYEEPIVTIQKPISSTCQCWDGRVVFAGRYGQWKKGVLAHEAFYETVALIGGN